MKQVLVSFSFGGETLKILKMSGWQTQFPGVGAAGSLGAGAAGSPVAGAAGFPDPGAAGSLGAGAAGSPVAGAAGFPDPGVAGFPDPDVLSWSGGSLAPLSLF